MQTIIDSMLCRWQRLSGGPAINTRAHAKLAIKGVTFYTHMLILYMSRCVSSVNETTKEKRWRYLHTPHWLVDSLGLCKFQPLKSRSSVLFLPHWHWDVDKRFRLVDALWWGTRRWSCGPGHLLPLTVQMTDGRNRQNRQNSTSKVYFHILWDCFYFWLTVEMFVPKLSSCLLLALDCSRWI